MQIEDIQPKGPYPPCLRMADRDFLAGYPRNVGQISLYLCLFVQKRTSTLGSCPGVTSLLHKPLVYAIICGHMVDSVAYVGSVTTWYKPLSGWLELPVPSAFQSRNPHWLRQMWSTGIFKLHAVKHQGISSHGIQYVGETGLPPLVSFLGKW